MKVLVFVKATPNSEQGIKPGPELDNMFIEMGKFNEQLIKAGIMQEADGLKPSSAGKRIQFKDGHTLVIDGPFAETKELVAGYWVWNVKSMDEAVEWARRCPNPMPGEEGMLEIRPCYSLEEFEEFVPKEEVAHELELRKQISRQTSDKGKRWADAGRKAAKAKAKAKAKGKAKGVAKRRPSRAKAKK